MGRPPDGPFSDRPTASRGPSRGRIPRGKPLPSPGRSRPFRWARASRGRETAKSFASCWLSDRRSAQVPVRPARRRSSNRGRTAGLPSQASFRNRVSQAFQGCRLRVRWPATCCWAARRSAKRRPPRIAQAGIETTVSAAVGATRRGLVIHAKLSHHAQIADSAPLDQVIRERLLSAEQGTLPVDASRFRRGLARAWGG